MVLMVQLVDRVEMKKRVAQRSESLVFVKLATVGIQESNVQNFGALTTRAFAPNNQCEFSQFRIGLN